MAQEIFERLEKKYMLPEDVYLTLVPELLKHMEADRYGKYTISNIYYDTPDFKLIRASIEKPVYREKLRLRCYGEPAPDRTVFLEIKKKFLGVVYKRRVPMLLKEAEDFLNRNIAPDMTGWGFAEKQILSEIRYMKDRNGLRPAASVFYDRIAFAGKEDPELRITFDNNIRCGNTDLTLMKGPGKTKILKRKMILMEVKIPGVMPLWMAELFEGLLPYRISFSKYGTYYRMLAEENAAGEQRRAEPAGAAETRTPGDTAGQRVRNDREPQFAA